MSIEIIAKDAKDNDLFESGCEVLVNAVNVIGAMGAGLARQFGLRYPRMYDLYKEDCRNHKLSVGKMHTYRNPDDTGRYKWIVNFPTMHFPGEITRRATLEEGFVSLESFIRDNNIKSIAIPALGGGIGRFPFSDLVPIVEAFSARLPGLKIKLYEPQ